MSLKLESFSRGYIPCSKILFIVFIYLTYCLMDTGALGILYCCEFEKGYTCMLWILLILILLTTANHPVAVVVV